MKRFLVVLALVFVAAGAHAQSRVGDVLLTDDGTLFTIDNVVLSSAEQDAAGIATGQVSVLRLRVQQAEDTETIYVPGSLVGGNHIEPSLAWDNSDSRLYIFWQRMPALGASELLFASWKNGDWSEVETFAEGTWRIRFNLKVAITRQAGVLNEDGTPGLEPALIAHAIWWEQAGDHEAGRYAMLELEQGEVRSVQIRDLTDFVTSQTAEPFVLPEEFDRNVFRTPFIFSSPEGDSIDVLFANWYTNRYQLINIKPVSDTREGVLHIPTGVTLNELNPSPIRVRQQSEGLTAMRSGGASGTIILYSNNGDSIDYAEYRKGVWSASKLLKIGAAMPLDTVLEGLRRRASQR